MTLTGMKMHFTFIARCLHVCIEAAAYLIEFRVFE
jgi:hypothetical protein